jgi:TfoX/Sxy family transcriptional regulator of competence genes
MNLQEQISRIQEVMGIKDMFKGMFGKKELTKDEKMVNRIVKFIKGYSKIEERDALAIKGNKVYWLQPSNTIVFYYDAPRKRLEYKWQFAQEIHKFIPDDRLLHLDSELMKKVFEKLYNKKVDKIYGYSELS